MKKATAAIVTTAILLAGCGSKANQTVQGGASATPAAVSTASPSPAATASPSLAPAPSTTPVPTPVPTAANAAKTYKLNKNYDIVPIDPNGNKKVALLTFDDGPKEKEMVESLLNTLDKHKAKAIFFVNGIRIKAKPELLKLIHERGQTVGNHTWSHALLSKVTDAQADEEFDSTQKIINDTIGVTPVFFRPPNGVSTDHLNERFAKEHILRMNWSNGSLDWADNQNKPEGVVKSVLDQLHPGSNILMHELPWTVKVLDELLTKLEEKGYSFVDPASIETP